MDRTKIGICIATDRNSNLPCDVVDHIFTCMPLRDAVRTSILSKEWRYKWVTIPNLIFDGKFEQKSLENHNLESIIYQVLSLHKGPIVEFTIKVHDFKTCPAISTWLKLLSSHHIEELNLQCSYTAIPHKVPCHLFCFDNLRHLYLTCGELKPPSAFNGFDKLVSLHLHNVQTASGVLSVFISKCPMLENLKLLRNMACTTFGDLEIDAPNLKSFDFLGKLDSICFKNASHLVDISIHCYGRMFEDLQIFQPHGNESNMSKLLGEVPSVERLECHHGFLKLLAIGGVPQKLPNILNCLTVLQLCHVYFDNIVEVTSALCLIRSCPILQSLEIRPICSHVEIDRTITDFLEEQQEFEFPLSHLKIVKFNYFSGSKPEMELVKIILSAANVLRKLEIQSRHAAVTEKGSEILRGLARFPRASSQAEFIFEDPYGR